MPEPGKQTINIYKVVKGIIWFFPVILIFWILLKYIVPSGIYEVRYDVVRGSPLVKNFASKEPDKLLGSKNFSGYKPDFQYITTSPVYFDVKVPGSFNKATVSLKYQNPNLQPEIKLGVRQSNGAYYYKNMSVYNRNLENLRDYWNLTKMGDVVLWQKNLEYYDDFQKRLSELDKRWEDKIKLEYGQTYDSLSAEKKEIINEKNKSSKEYRLEFNKILDIGKAYQDADLQYSTVDEFMDNYPDFETVLQYNYTLPVYKELPNYQPSSSILEIDKSLRGDCHIYTYLGQNESLDFKFMIQEINRHVGEDQFTITVYNSQNEKVDEVTVPDDGDLTASGKASDEQEVGVFVENLPFGTYHFEISSPNDEFLIKSIRTKQHLLMFRNKVYLADNEEYQNLLGDKKLSPTTIYTNSKRIKAKTSHQGGLQTLAVGWQNLNIDVKHVYEEMELGGEEVVSIVTPVNDVLIEGDGFFTFAKDHFFDPEYGKVRSVDAVEAIDDYDFIIANYPQPLTEGSWFVAEASIETPYLYINEGQDKLVNFIISLPGLPENNRILKIKEIVIRFEREPITINIFFSKLKNFLNRATGKEE